jgi:hypothetical protein
MKLNDMHIQKNNKIENLSLVHDKKYHIGESKDLIYFLDDVRNLSSMHTYDLNVKDNVIILKMFSAQNLISDYGIQFKQANFEQVYLTNLFEICIGIALKLYY